MHAVVAVSFAVLLYCSCTSAKEGCREAKLCCAGRDPSCMVQTLVYSSGTERHVTGIGRPCFCDHACVRVGDCCHDFQEVCGAVDCAVSSWGEWSTCSADCGQGVMTRERQVLRETRNGGAICPELLQKRSCFGNKCEGKPHSKANRETAMILPATLSSIRHLNSSQDIRNNLRLRYRKDPDEENSKQYCILFEVMKVRKTCESLGTDVSSQLSKGSTVCIACESAAMRKHLGYRCQGHGVDHKTTRFTYLAYPQCHGRWRRIEKSDACSCNNGGKANFIFV